MHSTNFVNKTRGFTSLDNSFLNNPQLSTGDKGLYAYLKSKPSGWNFSSDRISRDHKEGIRAIRASLTRLEEHSLVTMRRLGTGRVQYEIHDPQCSFGTVAKQHCAKTPQRQNVTHKQEGVISKKEKEVKKRERVETPDSLSVFDLFPVKTRRDESLRMIAEVISDIGLDALAEAVMDYAHAVASWPDELKPKIKTSYYFLLDKTYLDDSASYWKTAKPKPVEKPKTIPEPENKLWREIGEKNYSNGTKGDDYWDNIEWPKIPDDVKKWIIYETDKEISYRIESARIEKECDEENL